MRSAKSFKRETNVRVIFNGRQSSWVDIFEKNNITDEVIQRICKSLPKWIMLFGKDANIPMISPNTILKALFDVCKIDLQSVNNFNQVVSGLVAKPNHLGEYVSSISKDILNNGKLAFLIANGDTKVMEEVSTSYEEKDKNKIYQIAIEHFGLKAYQNIIKANNTIKPEDLICWCWALDAKKNNNFIEVLEEIRKKNKGLEIDTDYIIQKFGTKQLLKKQTQYISKWFDFEKTLINSNRFNDGGIIENIDEKVPLSELEKVMHFKHMLDQLATYNRYLSWKNKYDNTVTDEYISYTKYKDLPSLLNSIELPAWGLEYSINYCTNILKKPNEVINKKELFTDLKVLSEKMLLEKTLPTKKSKRNKTNKI